MCYGTCQFWRARHATAHNRSEQRDEDVWCEGYAGGLSDAPVQPHGSMVACGRGGRAVRVGRGGCGGRAVRSETTGETTRIRARARARAGVRARACSVYVWITVVIVAARAPWIEASLATIAVAELTMMLPPLVAAVVVGGGGVMKR